MAAAASDAAWTFHALAGNAGTNSAAFLASLVEDGPLLVRPQHWLARVLRSTLPSAHAGHVRVSFRLVVYVVLRGVTLATDLQSATCLPFFPLVVWLQQLFQRVVAAGIPFDEVADAVAARRVFEAYVARLPEAERVLSRADVYHVAAAVAGTRTAAQPQGSWLTAATPRMLVGAMSDNSAIVDLLTLLPGCFSITARDAEYDGALALMVPPAHQSAPPLVQAQHAAAALRKALAENPSDSLRSLVPFAGIVAELLRRLENTESERFVPLFDANFARAYPPLAAAFPSVQNGAELRRLVMAFAAGVGVAGALTDSFAEGLSLMLEPLVGLCDKELQGREASSARDRLASFIRLHKDMPSGRSSAGRLSGSASESLQGASRGERYDLLSSSQSYGDLYTKVRALDTTNFDVTGAISLLASHEHPAGLVFMTTSRSIEMEGWARLLSVRNKANWPAVFDARLGVDADGERRIEWGRMLPPGKDASNNPAALLLLGKLDQVKDWWSLCTSFIRQREGDYTLQRYVETTDPEEFWLDSARLRIAEEPLGIIFDVIGHGQSRSKTGSFRFFFAKHIARAERLERVPPEIQAYPALRAAVLAAVRSVFVAYSATHAAMLSQAFAQMERPLLIDPNAQSGPRVDLSSVDKRISELRTDLLKVGDGRAIAQRPHLQASGCGMMPLSAASLPSAASSSHIGSVVGSSSAISGPLSIPSSAGSSASQARGQWPAGVFEDWGNLAVKWGIRMSPYGPVFGTSLVENTGDAITIPDGSCIAAVGPGKGPRHNSRWCCTPILCLSKGYAAHELPPGVSSAQLRTRSLTADELQSKDSWPVVVAATTALQSKQALAPKPTRWSVDKGPVGDKTYTVQKCVPHPISA